MPIATSNFLVPNGTFIVVLLAFIIVLGIIGKKVLPILNKVLTERQEQIRGELEAADKAKADAEEADVERRADAGEGPGAGPRDRGPGQHAPLIRRCWTPKPVLKRPTTGSSRPPMPKWPWPARRPSRRCRPGSGRSCWPPPNAVIGREIQASDHQDLINEAIAAVQAQSTTGAAAGAAGSRR